MTARSLRRAAERKTAKLARKQAKAVEAVPPAPVLAEHESDSLREIRPIQARQAVREAPPSFRRRTGPTKAEGKAFIA